MYIGIGTIVVIVIIVLVVLMLRRLCYAAAPAILIRRLSKSHEWPRLHKPSSAGGRGPTRRPDRSGRPAPAPARRLRFCGRVRKQTQ
jgi:hypothetical protein